MLYYLEYKVFIFFIDILPVMNTKMTLNQSHLNFNFVDVIGKDKQFRHLNQKNLGSNSNHVIFSKPLLWGLISSYVL